MSLIFSGPIAVGRRLSVGLSVCLSTSVTWQPMVDLFFNRLEYSLGEYN